MTPRKIIEFREREPREFLRFVGKRISVFSDGGVLVEAEQVAAFWFLITL